MPRGCLLRRVPPRHVRLVTHEEFRDQLLALLDSPAGPEVAAKIIEVSGLADDVADLQLLAQLDSVKDPGDLDTRQLLLVEAARAGKLADVRRSLRARLRRRARGAEAAAAAHLRLDEPEDPLRG